VPAICKRSGREARAATAAANAIFRAHSSTRALYNCVCPVKVKSVKWQRGKNVQRCRRRSGLRPCWSQSFVIASSRLPGAVSLRRASGYDGAMAQPSHSLLYRCLIAGFEAGVIVGCLCVALLLLLFPSNRSFLDILVSALCSASALFGLVGAVCGVVVWLFIQLWRGVR
jgi:hypothetical protein